MSATYPVETPPAGGEALSLFHPLIREWFLDEVGTPTDVQALSWPRIAAGEHVLISAPTGSGKTLTAFLWALQRLFVGDWPRGQVRALYISPLRALNTDIRRNLERPLEALGRRFRDAGLNPPGIRALTRSGDTPQGERRRMLRHPPEILITTPESLNVLLTSQSGRSLLTGLETVILDEIHAVAASKRGTHLITAVERLVPLAGEFQRVALSATVRPMERIADFVGGWELVDTAGALTYRKREVSRIRSRAAKTYEIRVRFPATPSSQRPSGTDPTRSQEEEDSTWSLLVRDFKQVIRRNRSTLLFANSRRLTEKVTRLTNDGEVEDLAYSHHGSLSREVRSVVEKRLKEGDLRAIVATNSLELGIDIGELDEVVLIQSPRSVASAVQRVGRAGHGVGEVSRGVLYPTHGRDFLDAAVLARAVVEQDIEAVRPIEGALDVLAQVILSMVVAEPWHLDELFAHLKTSYPYRGLNRRQFDLVIDMLAGRYSTSRVRELRPRISIDKVSGTVKARRGAARLLYMAGGTIADRGYFALRLEDSMAKIGELDEEFVWERSIGDGFTLGAQSWQIRKITHNDVLVVPARGGAALAPFWRADAQDRDFFLSQKTADFLAAAEQRLGDASFRASLREEHCLEPAAADELVSFLELQKAATGGRLPSSRHLVAEHCRLPAQGDGPKQLILHTFWGGSVNRPLAIALMAAWDERFPDPLQVFHDDDCLMARVPAEQEAADLLALVDPEHLEELLRQRLESTGFFGAHFRVNASTALLLPKAGFRHRTPLWMNRQRAKKLLESVQGFGDFPVLVETWRTCLQDEFDLEHLREMLYKVNGGELPITDVRTDTPSPFAANLMWQHTNQLMYEDDTPEGAIASGVRQDLLKELVHASHLRPRLPADLVERFRRKAQRTAAGYAPPPGDELLGWIQERLAIPEGEWRELVDAVVRDHEHLPEDVAASIDGLALRVTLPKAEEAVVVARDEMPRLLLALALDLDDLPLRSLSSPRTAPPDELVAGIRSLLSASEADLLGQADSIDAELRDPLADLVGEWLRFQGVVRPGRLREVFGLHAEALADVLATLGEASRVVIDPLTAGAEVPEICDAENLEILLRWLRVDVRPSFEPLPAEKLPLFLAMRHGLVARRSSVEGLQNCLEGLFGWPAPAHLWESEILPARLDPYYPSWLDALLQETELRWYGCGKTRLSFAFPSDLELFRMPRGESEAWVELRKLFPAGRGGADLGELVEALSASGEPADTSQVSDLLWRLAWEGLVANDTFVAVRKGLENKFRPSETVSSGRRPSPRRRPGGRRSFDRWRASRPYFGRWYPIASGLPGDSGEDGRPGSFDLDALEQEELSKDRVRILLQRHGLLFRELLLREAPLLQWSRVFRSLRLMELSGEVLSGHFFRGIRGLQFISQAAFRGLQEGLPGDAIYWLCAADPASLCGIEVEGLNEELPARHATTHLVYHGYRLVMVSKRRGRELDLRVAADHPHLPDYLGVLKHLLTRDFQPLKSIDVETINGEAAARSPYADPLSQLFRTTRDVGSIKLWKRY